MPACLSSPPSVLHAFADAELPSDRLSAADSISLLQALAPVPDPRQRRGRRHNLQSILLLALGAVLASARSYVATAEWAAHPDHAVTVCGPTPHATTFGRVLGAVDAAALEAALTGWVLGRRNRPASRPADHHGPTAADHQVLAVDGKTLRGARNQTGSQAKLVAVYDHLDQLVLTQIGVADGMRSPRSPPPWTACPTCARSSSPPMRCTVSVSTRAICTAAAGTICSRSSAISRRCARLWPGCRGGRRPDSWRGTAATAAASRARSRSSTWTAGRPVRCSRTLPGRSRWSAADVAAASGPRPRPST